MPISDLCRVWLAGAFVVLAACEMPPVDSSGDAREGTPEMRRMVLEANGRGVVVAPPRGYCIDTTTATATAVLIGDCAAMGVDVEPAAAPNVLSLMSASVSDAEVPGSGGLAARMARLERVLQASGTGQLLAEGDGVARIVETHLQGDTVYVLVDDGSATAFVGAASRYWRAFSEENGRMIKLTVRALERTWPGEQALLDRAVAFRESVRRANAGAV